MKSCTDLNQSKKLAEILPIESADMHYVMIDTENEIYSAGLSNYMGILPSFPSWSLAALLELLDYPQLSKDKLGSGKVGWMISVYPNNCRYDSRWYDNPVDACVEMIIKIHELKIL